MRKPDEEKDVASELKLRFPDVVGDVMAALAMAKREVGSDSSRVAGEAIRLLQSEAIEGTP